MKIIVAGLGIRHAEEITIRTLRRLHECKRILVQSPAEKEIAATLLTQGLLHVEFLNSLYADGAVDVDNYASIKSRLIAAAHEHRTVAFLCPGHPRIGVTLVSQLEGASASMGFELEVLEGVSSFDTMINDVAIDPLERDSIVLDANRLVLFDIEVPKDLNVFLYHPSSVGNARTDISRPHDGARRHWLSEKLRRIYPPNKAMAIITSSADEGVPAQVHWFTLDAFETEVQKAFFWSSLYIPAENPTKINKRFLADIRMSAFPSPSRSELHA